MSAIYLIGSGPDAREATRRHVRRALRELGLKKALIAYVGTASNDDPTFFKMLSAMFAGTGARVELVRLARKSASVAKARQLLHDADVIFMSGGDVLHGINILRARGVDRDLRKLAAAGKPFIAVSAGSIMMCEKWVQFDESDESASAFKCLGIAKLVMDAHSEDDDWSELRVLLELLELLGKNNVGYGVPAKGCLQIGARGKLRAAGAAIDRLAIRGRKIVKMLPLLEK